MRLTKAEKQKIIAGLIKTPVGRQEIASSLVEPLRKYRDYESVGRRAFMIDQLADGALPCYDKDPELKAFTVGEEGQDPIEIVKGDRVFVPLREIATNPTIPMTQIKARKYDVENRVQVKSKSELFREEDEMIFSLFSAVANKEDAVNTPVVVAEADMTIDHFSEAMGQIESHGNVRCANIFMNPRHMKTMRKIGKDYFEPATTSELLKTGQMGDIFGAVVHTSAVIPKDEIYFTSEAEYFGIFVEAIELTVIPADVPAERKIGWSVFEQVGALINSSQVISLIKVG